tara:strand:- start:96 stop:638 length:543 start_codon:yes stop_codon:yes gene_type:complete
MIFSIVAVTFLNSEYLKARFIRDFMNIDKILLKDKSNTSADIYFKLYKSGLTVFKNYPIFGVGNKNYRIITCTVDGGENYPEEYICNTHPHQIYIEILSEHGIVGMVIILYILFKLIFTNLPVLLKSKNYIQIGCFTYLLCTFLPIIPGGAFFNDFSSNLFWLNMSILYASSKKTNIFVN